MLRKIGDQYIRTDLVEGIYPHVGNACRSKVVMRSGHIVLFAPNPDDLHALLYPPPVESDVPF